MMVFYQVKSKPKDNLIDLRFDLSHGIIRNIRPFGNSLQHSLENAKLDSDEKYAIWIEEDYYYNPTSLAMEREAILDKYFDDIKVESVLSEKEGWDMLMDKPSFWKVIGLKE